MGYRFRKSVSIGKFARINFSKSGVGYSFGTKGYRVTKMANGRTRTTASLPGSGIFYVSENGSSRKSSYAHENSVNRSGCFCCYSVVPEEYDFCPLCGCDLRPFECPPELERPPGFITCCIISALSFSCLLFIPSLRESIDDPRFSVFLNVVLFFCALCSLYFGISAYMIKKRATEELNAMIESVRKQRCAEVKRAKRQ